ncbi:MAG TPA: PAS domain S-box protein [Rubrivivax sp.]|nr:PAS domain S-box protein [Rubrivivax sp.]HPO19935.1 PAS domain S-box protein [Rubrivivax sp.]
MTPQASSDLAERVLEQMAEAVVYADRSGAIERWNGGATAVFGFAADEALGHSLDLIIPEQLRAAHWRGYQAAMASGTLRLAGRPTLTRGLHKSGLKLYVEMSFSLVRDTHGQVIGSVAVARDVSERVNREKAARSAQPGSGGAQ